MKKSKGNHSSSTVWEKDLQSSDRVCLQCYYIVSCYNGIYITCTLSNFPTSIEQLPEV